MNLFLERIGVDFLFQISTKGSGSLLLPQGSASVDFFLFAPGLHTGQWLLTHSARGPWGGRIHGHIGRDTKASLSLGDVGCPWGRLWLSDYPMAPGNLPQAAVVLEDTPPQLSSPTSFTLVGALHNPASPARCPRPPYRHFPNKVPAHVIPS